MPTLQLSEEELSDTLHRAREIAARGSALAAPGGEYEAYLKAAEEMGIPREALIHALRERMLVSTEAVEAGQILFAPSVDGFWYPATVLQAGDHTCTVSFLTGGEHTVATSDLRPLALIPGRKLEADLPDWGWWSARVEKYDAHKGKIRVVYQDWTGGKGTVSLQKIRLPKKLAQPETEERSPGREPVRSALLRVGLVAGGLGLALGVLLDRLLPLALPFLR